MDGTGDAMAVWRQHDGTRYNIWGKYFDGIAWHRTVLIETVNRLVNCPQANSK